MDCLGFIVDAWKHLDLVVRGNEEWAAWVQVIGTLIGMAIAYFLGGVEHRHQKAIQKEEAKERLNHLKVMAFTCENALHSAVALVNARLSAGQSNAEFFKQMKDLNGRIFIIKRRMKEYPLSAFDAQEVHQIITLEHGLDVVNNYFSEDTNFTNLGPDVTKQRLGKMIDSIEQIYITAQCLLDNIDKRIAQV